MTAYRKEHFSIFQLISARDNTENQYQGLKSINLSKNRLHTKHRYRVFVSKSAEVPRLYLSSVHKALIIIEMS